MHNLKQKNGIINEEGNMKKICLIISFLALLSMPAYAFRISNVSSSGSGSGDVVGPVSSTDNTVVRFDGITGKLIQDGSVCTIDDDGIVTETVTLNNATGNEVAHTINYTTNKATSGDDTGLQINMTDTGSPGTSLGLECKHGANSVLAVDMGNERVGIGTITPEFRLTLDKGAATPNGGILAIGTYGSGTALATAGAGTRMIWYPKKAAFRAGYVTGTQWDADMIGGMSVAMGYNTTSSAQASFAMGYNTTSSGQSSFAMGESTTSSGSYSTAIGKWLTAGTADNTIVLGQGADSSNRLVNNTASSLMVGFNSTVPTLFVGPSAGAGTTGNVGIGTTSPDQLLHAEKASALTNTIQQVARLSHITSGTPANGIGLGLEFEQETTDNNNEVIATIEAVITDVTSTSEDADLVFKTMAAGAAAGEKLRITSLGSIIVPTTITAPGTTGDQTINKAAGRVNIAAAGTTVTVTNSLVTANSIVMAVAATADATAVVKNVVPAAGSFVINTVAVTAETAFNFFVISQ